MSKRITIAALGSSGDLNPLLAIALGLRARGHRITVATYESHRAQIVGLGLGFRQHGTWRIAPRYLAPSQDPDAHIGPFLRDVIFPHIGQSYRELKAATEAADLLVSQMHAYAAPLVAGTTGVPWASVVLQPLGFFSAFDPLVLFDAAAPSGLYEADLASHRLLLSLAWHETHASAGPIRQLRKELGLPAGSNPFYDDHHSPDLVLALFSPIFGPRQPDWPAQTRITGFPFLDAPGGDNIPAALREFLASGSAPIVFTLGSHAASDTAAFFANSLAAATILGRRAVFVGAGTRALLAGTARHPAGRNAIAFDHVPFAQLFPQAVVVVHHGGPGTIALSLRAGRPMLLVPVRDDHPHNSLRAARLGCARVVSYYAYTPQIAAAEIARLLEDPRFALMARARQQEIAAEDGVEGACDALEELMERKRPAQRASEGGSNDDRDKRRGLLERARPGRA